jgi:nucleoside-diphosphate-sugar epimerase
VVKYFVTGATGFVGGRVARLLMEEGHQVVAVVRDPSRARALADLGVSIYQGDVTDRESLHAPMVGVDGVYHIAGWYKIGTRDKSAGMRVNVQGTRNVLQVMKDLAIPRGVYTSTLAVFSDTHGRMVDETYRYDGPHLTEYDRTKWLAHYEVAEPMIQAGLPLTIVQPGLIYGPGDTSSVHTTLVQYLQRRLPMVPSRTAFCWAHVDDVARGHLLAMDRGVSGQTYIIAGPGHTLVDALGLAQSITGISAPRLHAAPSLMKAMAAAMSVVEMAVPVPETYSGESLRTLAGTTYLGSNARARRELGYLPRPLAEGLAETLRHEMRLLGIA